VPVTAERVRAAFTEQAGYCRRLDAPLTANLCEALAAGLTGDDEVGRAVLAWQGDPAPLADNVPLRIVGALNALVRAGRAPYLATHYPPHPLPEAAELSPALQRALREHAHHVLAFLASPPQTNEVGRSAILIGGFLAIAAQTGLPLALNEIGASAGLNLVPDRYRYRLGEASWGSPNAKLLLEPRWTGASPPVDAPLRVVARRGCDRSPIDIGASAERERLTAYIWADQPARLVRLSSAIDTALADRVAVERADAAEWIEREFTPRTGITQVLFHSVVWGYLAVETRERIQSCLAHVGASARADGPVAWLRFEMPGQLRLTLWPGGSEHVLANAHPHGEWIEWLG
jgi:hypothetical protein